MIKTKCDICKKDLGIVIETNVFICEECTNDFIYEESLYRAIWRIKERQGLLINNFKPLKDIDIEE